MSTHPQQATETDRLWTEAEFLALSESTERVELIDGEIVREPSADFGHQARVGKLHRSLYRWAGTRSPRPDVCLSPLDVKMAAGRILQPDVFVHLVPLPRPVCMPITAIPDLCIEVVSSNRVYDRVMKREIYAAAGVREYWTVVAALGIVERWTGARLATREEHRDRLVTPLLPDFALDVADLLREP